MRLCLLYVVFWLLWQCLQQAYGSSREKLIWKQTALLFLSEENTSESITYKGKTYVYNDHLSNYLFMGLYSKGDMETAESGNAGQADAVFLVSVDRVSKGNAGDFHSP